MAAAQALARQLGVENDVIFLGQRSDVRELLSAFDAFLLPSLYEGFPVALVEAQANGLKCFVSKEAVPAETDITGRVSFIPLSESDDVWAETVLRSDLSRDFTAPDRVKAAGYDIADAAGRLKDI